MIVIWGLALLQSDQDVDCQCLHRREQVPLVESGDLLGSVACWLGTKGYGTSTCSLSHSSLTFFQNNLRLPGAPLYTICIRVTQVVSDSKPSPGLCELFPSEYGWMNGGRDPGLYIVLGKDVSMWVMSVALDDVRAVTDLL